MRDSIKSWSDPVGRRMSGQVNGTIQVISSLEDVDPLPDFVLECASHQAVAEYGPYFLEKGIDFGVVSIGAFSDPDVYDRLAKSSRSGGAQLCILPGAVGGMDALSRRYGRKDWTM